MKPEDEKKFSELLKAVFTVYGKDYSLAMLDIWWAALERFSFADVSRALSAHVSNAGNGQFLPKPADVVRFIEGDAETKSLRAWSKVLASIKSIGCYKSVAFDDHAIHYAIEKMGGWHRFSLMQTDEEPFKAREFQKLYEAGIGSNDLPSKLIGHSEAQNRSNGFEEHANDVVLIGDHDKARLILEHGRSGGFLKTETIEFKKSDEPSKAKMISDMSAITNKLSIQ